MKRKRLLSIAAVVVLTGAIAGGIAYATIPGPGNVYSACMLKGVGQIRLIDKSLPPTNPMSRCTDKEAEISWNEAGQPGPQGLQGPKGATGATGANGATGAKGDKGDPGNLALAGRSCAEGSFVTGFDQNGDLVCAKPGDDGGGGGGGGEPGELLVSPAQLDFPSTPVGTVSDPIVLTLTNTESTDVFVPIIVTGDNFADFAAGGCQTVPAHGTCALSVVFMPTGAGIRRALMTLQGPNGENVLVPLSGVTVSPA